LTSIARNRYENTLIITIIITTKGRSSQHIIIIKISHRGHRSFERFFVVCFFSQLVTLGRLAKQTTRVNLSS
jgi:hypothetical protein